MALTIRHYRPYTPPPTKRVRDDSIYCAPFRVRGLVRGRPKEQTARHHALVHKLPTYEGKVCPTCNGTTRLTQNYECINCPRDTPESRATPKNIERPGMWEAVELICRRHGFTVDQMKGRGSSKELRKCQDEAWLEMTRFGEGYREIGRLCGGRHHRTIWRRISMMQS